MRYPAIGNNYISSSVSSTSRLCSIYKISAFLVLVYLNTMRSDQSAKLDVISMVPKV